LNRKEVYSGGVNTPLSLGEYVRRLRRRKGWQLQELANATGLSLSHLSRIENDNALPNADTVVRLAQALDGELEQMLQMADCLPREILARLIRRAEDSAPSLHRAAGEQPPDADFSQVLVDDMDPQLRRMLADRFSLSERDVHGIFSVLHEIGHMAASEREAIIAFLATRSRGKPTG
jgi:transcriptional regulator with XRE-family HTH domain